MASKNFLLPNLDFVGRYRWRGFGDDLLDPQRRGRPRFDNAYMDLNSGDFQEWQAGMELSMPIGFRHAHTAMKNAELQLVRERTVLRAEERDVIHGLSDAVADMERAYAVTQTALSRMNAAKTELQALRARIEAEGDQPESNLLDLLLDAQRRYAEAQSSFYRAEVEFVVAAKNIHLEKGSLLQYCGVQLSEGPWAAKAYRDAAKLEHRRGRHLPISYNYVNPRLVACPTCGVGVCRCNRTAAQPLIPAPPNAPWNSSAMDVELTDGEKLPIPVPLPPI